MVIDTLYTARLEIRAMHPCDAHYAMRIWGDPEGGKYLQDPWYQSAEELERLLQGMESWSDYSCLAFDRSTGEFVGTCSIGPESDPDEWGIGYGIVAERQGRGYATEMARALIDFGLSRGVFRFTGDVAQENKASCRVMERLGMRVHHTGAFRKGKTGPVYPSYTYKLDRRSGTDE